ncbi:hypothetical protein WOLCODRAFT_165972 [Wolfiporia cocos MD-104 SS10]|uniref:Peptidase C14 caspase domain-containing protein n=1 Tax=Wolfiporia cocos (strain MD-104) TaxID=742152 RepID=A0A2H3IYF1_WOLCO|nr:hypothetical protein WOLCODRAFT_165972 [Wolfiporia cocos MD-104 SS10]
MAKIGPRRTHAMEAHRSRFQRKALLIGINYGTQGSPQNSEYATLVGPHKDVKAFKSLLIEQYNYAAEDVTVMCDDENSPPELQPTHVNIRHQISNLVRGASPGDRFVFLFSGHSDQIVCLDHSEEDDQDEVILPMDHEGLEKKEKLIIDNDLRKLLVDPLPAGAYLTAIFDSCHSGTLLDLRHYRCNAIYHPWVSKGERQLRSRWMDNVRKDAAIPELTRQPTMNDVIHQLGQSHRSSLRKKSAPVVRNRSLTATLHSASTSLEQKRARPILRLSDKFLERASTALELVIPQCASPTSMVRECDGNCVASPTEKPHVISIAACADKQIDWEDQEGGSMTQVLIRKLRKEPTPTLRQLMTFISYRRYEVARMVHLAGNRWLKGHKARAARNRSAGDASILENDQHPDLVNFQDPQLGSQEKLNLEAMFTL